MGLGANVEYLHLRLYLEGLEVPVIAGTVNCSMNSPVSAQFEIVATDLALRLKPRTTVHAFFLDTRDSSYSFNANMERSSNSFNPSAGAISNEEDVYKLLFCGEVFDIIFSKSGAGSRSVVLNCLDFSSLWDTTYIYLLRFASGMGTTMGRTLISGTQSVFLGAPELADDSGINSPTQLIARIASQSTQASSPGLSEVTNNLGGLLSVLELIGGIPGATLGLYDWQTVQERRVRLMDQIATDSGKTAANIFQQTILEEWLTNNLGEAGDYISFREIIEMIMSYVYYGVAPQPVAVYQEGSRATPAYILGESPPSSAGSADLRNVDPDMVTAYDAICEYMATEEGGGWGAIGTTRPAPQVSSSTGGKHVSESYHYYGLALDLVPPGYNLGGFYHDGNGVTTSFLPQTDLTGSTAPSATPWNIARSLLNYDLSIKTVRQLEEEILRRYGSEGDSIVANLKTTVQFYLDLNKAVQFVNNKQLPATSVQRTQDTIKVFWGDALGEKKDPLLALYGQDKGMTGGDVVHIDLSKSHTRKNKVSGITQAKIDPQSKVAGKKRQRLYTQIFRPDCWFVAPPVCNVIYPEEYTSFSFRRQMMREITRLELDTFNIMVKGALLRTVYFAPRIVGQESLEVSGTQAKDRIVYKHERFGGIIPKTEQMPDLPFYAKQEINKTSDAVSSEEDISRQQVNLNDDGKGESVDEAAKSVIDRFAAKAVTFHFLSYRYSARTMSVSGRFMPRLVMGFPGVVLDKPATSYSTRPIHHLGMVTSIQHTLNQSGGYSFASFSHARSHRTSKNEIDDLFAEQVIFDVQEEVKSGSIRDLPNTGGLDLAPPFESWVIALDAWIRNRLKLAKSANAEIEERNQLIVLGTLDGEISETKALPVSWGEGELAASGLVGPTGKPFKKVIIQGDAPADTTQDVTDPVSGELVQTTVTETSRTYTTITYEEGIRKDVPLEEAIRPPWFDDEYSNDKIDGLYAKFFDCKSILGSTGKKSVEEAVDDLVNDYTLALAQAEGRAQAATIYSKTKRAMASYRQVLGTNNSNGKSAAFHGYAVGKYTQFEGLELRNPVDEFGKPVQLRTPLLGTINSGLVRDVFNTNALDFLDVRKERREAVAAYQLELLGRRGIRG